jgi:hypothetical protein
MQRTPGLGSRVPDEPGAPAPCYVPVGSQVTLFCDSRTVAIPSTWLPSLYVAVQSVHIPGAACFTVDCWQDRAVSTDSSWATAPMSPFASSTMQAWVVQLTVLPLTLGLGSAAGALDEALAAGDDEDDEDELSDPHP